MYRQSLGAFNPLDPNPLETAVAQAKENSSTALWWGLGMLAAVGFLVFRPGRR